MNTHEAIKILLHTAWLGSDGDREKIEQAIEVVAEALEQSCDNDCEHCEWVTCPKMEQEPCEDAVSRKALLDKAYAYGNGLEPEGYCVNVEDVQALPPVAPTRIPENGDIPCNTCEYFHTAEEALPCCECMYSKVSKYRRSE